MLTHAKIVKTRISKIQLHWVNFKAKNAFLANCSKCSVNFNLWQNEEMLIRDKTCFTTHFEAIIEVI